MDTQFLNENGQVIPENSNQKKQGSGVGETIAAGAVGAAVGVGGSVLANELIDNEGDAALEQQIAQAEKELQQAEEELAETQQMEDVIANVEIDRRVFDGPMPPPPPHVHVHREPDVNINVEHHIHQGPVVAGDTRTFVSGTSGTTPGNQGGQVRTGEFEENIVDAGEIDQDHTFAILGRGVVQDENSGEERLAVVVESDGERYYLIDANGDGFFNNLVDATGSMVDMNETSYPTNLTLGDVENMYDTSGGYVETLAEFAQVEPQGENPIDDIINLDGSNAQAQTASAEPVMDDQLAAVTHSAAGSTAGSTADANVSDEELYNQLFGDDTTEDDIAVYDDNSVVTSDSGDTSDYAMEPQPTTAYDETASAQGDTSDYGTEPQPTTAYEETASTSAEPVQSYEPEPDYTASTAAQDNYTPENDYYDAAEADYTASVDVQADDFSVDMIDTSEV